MSTCLVSETVVLQLSFESRRFVVFSAGLLLVVLLIFTGCSDTTIATTTKSVYTAVSVGYDHSCALDMGGRITCWGSNENGQLDMP
ncbi:MAG: RCC1 domain-containing protein [Acidimicrobiaceae bacterium]|nr:RCC1 domain-containing protein [Acidimicrobiaceae bacterium]